MSPHQPRGEIYDLGYRHYDGPRLGRGYAVRSLIALSVRNTFGLGRGVLPKVLAFGLVLCAFVPAVAQVAIAAVGRGIFEVVAYQEYFGAIQAIMVLFVAAMSSDLVGNDRRNNTLPLYFSRPIRHDDYIMAKLISLGLALLVLTLGPLLLIFIGGWLGALDGTAWLSDNLSDIPRILVSSVLVSAQLAAIGIAIAMFASRRSIAMTSVLAAFLVSFIATGILVSFADRAWAAAIMLISPLFVSRAVTLVVFDAVPQVSFSHTDSPPDMIAYADLPGWVWIAALLVQVALAIALAVHRYRRSA